MLPIPTIRLALPIDSTREIYRRDCLATNFRPYGKNTRKQYRQGAKSGGPSNPRNEEENAALWSAALFLLNPIYRDEGEARILFTDRLSRRAAIRQLNFGPRLNSHNCSV